MFEFLLIDLIFQIFTFSLIDYKYKDHEYGKYLEVLDLQVHRHYYVITLKLHYPLFTENVNISE